VTSVALRPVSFETPSPAFDAAVFFMDYIAGGGLFHSNKSVRKDKE